MRSDILTYKKITFILLLLIGVKFIFVLLLLDSLKFYPYLIAEITIFALINIFTRPNLTKFFLFICIVIESMQLANLYSTGNYIDPLTILNIQEYHVIGKELLIKASLIIL